MGHTVLLDCQDLPASMGTVFWYAEGTWATSSKVDAFCRDKEKSRLVSLLLPSQDSYLGTVMGLPSFQNTSTTRTCCPNPALHRLTGAQFPFCRLTEDHADTHSCT